MVPDTLPGLPSLPRSILASHLRRQSKLVCRDLTISGGFSVFTMAVASSLGLASIQSALFFIGGALIAHCLAIHRVLHGQVPMIDHLSQATHNESTSAAA